MNQTLSNAAALLKRVYLPTLRNQLNNVNYFLSQIEREKEAFIGTQAYIAVKKGRNFSTQGVADNGTLPSADRQRYANAIFGLKYIYSRFDITGPLMAAAKGSDAGAFVNALDAEVTGTIEDATDHLGRMLFSDGTGALATISSRASSATMTLDNVLYFKDRIGTSVQVVERNTGSILRATTTVDAVNITNKTITLADSVNLTGATDPIVIKPSSYLQDINGLDVIVSAINVPSTGLFQGLDRTAATSAFWQGLVLSNSGTARPVSEPLLQDAYDSAEQLAGGTQQDMGVDLITSSYAVRKKYISLLLSQKRFVNNLVLKGGWKAIEYNGTPWIADKYCPNKAYFLKLSSFKLYVQEDWGWMDEDGKMLFRLTGKDGYEAVLKWYGELACDAPNRNVVVTDLDVT